MNKYLKIGMLGLISWLVPFITGFFFFKPDGTMAVSMTFFKTIMIVESTALGCFLLYKYFKDIKKDYVKEALIVGLGMLMINWALDLAMVFSGFFDMTIWVYFAEIGLRYLNIVIISLTMGYLLNRNL